MILVLTVHNLQLVCTTIITKSTLIYAYKKLFRIKCMVKSIDAKNFVYVSCGTIIVIGAHHTKSLDMSFFVWDNSKKCEVNHCKYLLHVTWHRCCHGCTSILEACEAMKCIMLLVVYVFGLVSVEQNRIGQTK